VLGEFDGPSMVAACLRYEKQVLEEVGLGHGGFM